jgi:hypothetical protein
MDTPVAGPVLGVFCPFWSSEGPHFVLPHFQGILRAVGVEVSVLDLNIDCAEVLAAEWSSLSENHGGLWSDPGRVAEIVSQVRLAERLLGAISARHPAWVVFLGVNVASYHVVRELLGSVRAACPVGRPRLAVGGPLCLHLDGIGQAMFPGADLVSSEVLEAALPHLTDGQVLAAAGGTLPRFRPDFTGIAMGRYTRPERLTYLLNYGCRFRCRFCHEGSQYRREIPRRTVGLARELGEIVAGLPTVRYIRFFDSSLNSDHNQFLDLLDELTGADLLWGCYLTPTPRIDFDVARRMVAAGCMGVNIGVESGATDVRRLMAKPSPRIDVVDDCLGALSGAGLDVSVNLIVGYPGETERDVDETLRFLDRSAHLLSDVAVGKAGIYMGTPLFDEARSRGIELGGSQSTEFVFNHWRLSDGSNTPEIRAARLERVEAHLVELGFPNARSSGAPDPGRRALQTRGQSICAE